MHSPMPSLQHCPKRASDDIVRTAVRMGTFVTVHVIGQVVGAAAAEKPERQSTALREEAVERAFTWFDRVEECCTRFDAGSELMRLAAAQPGVPVPVSTLLYEAVQFALEVAEESGGAFDPTVGHAMETRGFNREYRTGKEIHAPADFRGAASYRDVRLDPERQTIMLLRPLVLDLGAVAKGLAVDLAARELAPFENFAINAGGDLYLGGCNAEGEPWSIGIRHPRSDTELIDLLRVSNRAVCTSGDYEKRSADGGHHILDPRTGGSANGVASVTVIAPTAMLADALATAAFVLGPADGIRLFERLGVDGLIFATSELTPDSSTDCTAMDLPPNLLALRRYATQAMHEYL
jgi:FAD:protein FMN transferase